MVVLKNCLWVVSPSYWGGGLKFWSSFMNLGWWTESKPGWLDFKWCLWSCSHGSVAPRQRLSVEYFFQIQFLNQQMCSKIPRKQEKKHICFCRNVPSEVSVFHSQMKSHFFLIITWSVTCPENNSVSLLKTDKTVSELIIIKIILNLWSWDKKYCWLLYNTKLNFVHGLNFVSQVSMHWTNC